MELHEAFQKALHTTQILRCRQPNLFFASETVLPFVLLSESVMNDGDTVVRTGKVTVDRPTIIVPGEDVMFEGFEDEDQQFQFKMLGRMVKLPRGKYSLNDCKMEVIERSIARAVDEWRRELDDDAETGLCVCSPDIWQLSVVVYVGNMVVRSAGSDLDDFVRRGML